MDVIKGIPVSAGIAIGAAFLWAGGAAPEIPRLLLKRREDGEKERVRFNAAVERAAGAKRRLLGEAADKAERDIIKSQILMLEDVELREQVYARLAVKQENAEWAVRRVARDMARALGGAADPYLRERAADIADLEHELIFALLGRERPSLSRLKEDAIIVACDLLPSELVTLDKKHARALALDRGSATSHAAILARSFEIPAVFGLEVLSLKVTSGEALIVDALAGEVCVGPDAAERRARERALRARRREEAALAAERDAPARTRDGELFTVKANIELAEDAARAYRYGAQGIGLFRSEFLFLTAPVPPDEEAQYEAYGAAVRASGGLPVTIRTSDAGGDKMFVGGYGAEAEKNPLLGWRAIRRSLAEPELFKTQLRAILRASAHGPVGVMFPMISGVDELRRALALLDEAKAECEKRRQRFDAAIKTGTMIEVPAAALVAGALARMVDFFSIGTNDLAQYALAVDRGNEKISYLADPAHPAIIRLLGMTVDAARGAGIPAAVCGQMAADGAMIPLLVGLGVDEFSASATSVPHVKAVIRGLDAADCRRLAAQALLCGEAAEVRALLAARPARRKKPRP